MGSAGRDQGRVQYLGLAEGGAVPALGPQEQGEGLIPEPGKGSRMERITQQELWLLEEAQPAHSHTARRNLEDERPQLIGFLPLISCQRLFSSWANPTRGQNAWEPSGAIHTGQPPGLRARGERGQKT